MRILMEILPINVLLAFIVAVAAVAVFKFLRKPSDKKLIFFFIKTFFAAVYVFMACRILFNITKFGIYGNPSPYYGNYIPFKTITEYVKDLKTGHFFIFITQVAGNILITVPLPFVVRFCLRKRKMSRICTVSLILTAAIEPLQLLINIFLGGPSNIIDIDDLILNLTGCALGLFFVFLLTLFTEIEYLCNCGD